jgi:hypothetical protein
LEVGDYRIYPMSFEDVKCFVSTGRRLARKANLREYRGHDFSSGNLIVHD